MIEKVEDLDLKPENTFEEMLVILQEKLGISVNEMQMALSASVQEKAHALTHEFTNIAPMGDYSKLLEDNDSMAEFLHTEAHKPEHWVLSTFRTNGGTGPEMLKFTFKNFAVDDGEAMSGFVFVSFNGKIKHAFAQGNE